LLPDQPSEQSRLRAESAVMLAEHQQVLFQLGLTEIQLDDSVRAALESRELKDRGNRT